MPLSLSRCCCGLSRLPPLLSCLLPPPFLPPSQAIAGGPMCVTTSVCESARSLIPRVILQSGNSSNSGTREATGKPGRRERERETRRECTAIAKAGAECDSLFRRRRQKLVEEALLQESVVRCSSLIPRESKQRASRVVPRLLLLSPTSESPVSSSVNYRLQL